MALSYQTVSLSPSGLDHAIFVISMLKARRLGRVQNTYLRMLVFFRSLEFVTRVSRQSSSGLLAFLTHQSCMHMTTVIHSRSSIKRSPSIKRPVVKVSKITSLHYCYFDATSIKRSRSPFLKSRPVVLTCI